MQKYRVWCSTIQHTHGRNEIKWHVIEPIPEASVLFVTNTVSGLGGDQGVVVKFWGYYRWLMTHLLQLIQFRLYGNWECMSETQRNKPQSENKTISILYAVHKVIRNERLSCVQTCSVSLCKGVCTPVRDSWLWWSKKRNSFCLRCIWKRQQGP